MLLHLKVDCAGLAGSIRVEGDAVRVALEALELLPQVVQSDLRLLHGALQLLVLHVSVEELVHDVHHIRQARHLADLLKAILGVLGPFHLFKSHLLQAVPSKLLHRVELPEAARGGVEGLVGRVQRHLVAPAVEISPPSVGLLPLLELSIDGFQGGLAHVSLHCGLLAIGFQSLVDLHLGAPGLLALSALLLELTLLSLQVLLHLKELLLQNRLFPLGALQHVLVDLAACL
mmetsp:Transcript_38399/g.91737  ORF Transcript_38399/g.91737 Transcript_38399/m.91737 type:complete len:231 (-) Transcript_38399:361-1053(-)